MILEIKDLHIHYDKIEAVKGISLNLPEGGIITLIGANGAGKSSILKSISGLVRPSSGEIRYQGERIDTAKPHKIVEMGIAHVPEGRCLFQLMTVHDNLRVGAYSVKDKELIEERFSQVYTHFPILKEKEHQLAAQLSGGQQQMVAMGRAMMARPKLILMDEPSLGLAPIMIDEIVKIVTMLRDSGMSIVLVEQNANLALKLADHAYVLETGSVALEGKADELLNDPNVAKAYLGA